MVIPGIIKFIDTYILTPLLAMARTSRSNPKSGTTKPDILGRAHLVKSTCGFAPIYVDLIKNLG
jgi:hypothetical protein